MADYYELLGVSAARAGRRDQAGVPPARPASCTPTPTPATPRAAERFKEVARAYEVLSDPDQRARYDRFGEAGVGGADGGPRIGRHLPAAASTTCSTRFFGGSGARSAAAVGAGPAGPPRGQDLEVVADITFEQAVFGATVPVTLRAAPALRATATGRAPAPAPQPVTCADCNGAARCSGCARACSARWSPRRPCPRCGGLGQVVVTPCPTCRGEGRVTADHTYQVDVPAGVDTGSTLRLTGRGAAGPRGGRAGDLYVHLRVAEHERYRRDGNDLVTDVPISIAQAALGTTVTLPTLDGDEELVVPAGHPAGPGVRAARAAACPGCRAAAVATCGPSSSSRCRRSSTTRRPTLLRQLAEKRGEPVEPAGQGPVLADQVGVLVGRPMDEALRRSAAHVLVADVAAPVARRRRRVHHLRRVLRLRDGDAVTVTDGAGRWRAVPLAAVALEPDGAVDRRRRARPPVTIAVAPPKGERLEWLVQKCTEVGVDRIVLLDAERSVVRWDGERAERQLDRLRRIAVEAAMQSRRVWLPELSRARPGGRRAGVEPSSPSRVAGRVGAGDTVVAIGPEGGWSPAELAAARRPVSLGAERAAGRDGRRRRGGADGGRRCSGEREPFGVYVHVPFCSTRCDYCAFATWTDRPHLIGDVPRRACAPRSRAPSTPGWRRRRACSSAAARRRSCPPSGLAAVLRAIPLAPGAEVTVECNPDDVTEAMFETYAGAGVNRVSIGVQSMVPHVLAALGRTHDPANVERAVAAARAVGLPTFNVDIIYGAAGESLGRLAHDAGAARSSSSRRTCRRTR